MGWVSLFSKAVRSTGDDVAGAARHADEALDTARATDDFAPAAVGDAGLSRGSRFVLGTAKTGMYVSAATGALYVTEYATGGALSKATPGAVHGVADALEESFPDLAQAVRENGMSALEAITDFTDTDKEAATNLTSGALEEADQAEMAMAVRIGGAITSANFYLTVANAEEGERAQAVVDQIVEQADVEESDLEQYFITHPTQTALLEEQLGINLEDTFPNLRYNQQAYRMNLEAERNGTNMPFAAAAAPAAAAAAGLTPTEQLQAMMAAAQDGMENGLQNMGALAMLGQLVTFIAQAVDKIGEEVGLDLFEEGHRYDWRTANQPSAPELV